MKSFTTRIAVCLSLLVVFIGQQAQARDVTMRTIQYSIRYNPESSTSPVHWIMQLTVSPVATSGSVISWQPVELSIREKDTSGGTLGVWIDDAPEAESYDGLWHITHEDAENPALFEFFNPPTVSGEAVSKDNSSDVVEYSFEGAASLIENPPTAESTSTRLNYALNVAPGGDPIDDGDDEKADGEAN